MIGWLLNTESGVYHPINDLGTLYPGVFTVNLPDEPIMGTLTPVKDESGYGVIGFHICPFPKYDQQSEQNRQLS